MDKLLIIDGNNLLFQMFYGIPNKIYNKNGETNHATIGFISYVIKIIKKFEITKCCVVFDKDTNKKRKELHNDYKSNRVINWNELPQDEVPFNEEVKIIKCLDYLGIKTLYSSNMEADDLIASITKSFDNSNEIIISSFDSDFFQLINENVKVLRCRGKNLQIYDLDYFIEKFGFTPDKYVLYKAIVGDTADNINGIYSIGPKRTTNLLKTYNNIEEMKISKVVDKYKDLILTNLDLVYRNIKLIKLEQSENLVFDINYFEFNLENVQLNNSTILSNCEIF